jgi:outer membrane protein assembly factor BamD (BamD/ComL family)
MPKFKIRLIIVLSVMLMPAPFAVVIADIRFSDQDRQDGFSMAVAHIKVLVDTGRCREAQQAFEKLKTDFPEITVIDSNDLELFIQAEILRCNGKLSEASAGFRKLLDEYPDGRFYDAALDRQFRIAAAFLAGQKRPFLGIFKIKGYSLGVRLMEDISYRVSLDDPAGMGTKAALAVAEHYQQREKYEEAFHRWAEIHEQHGTNRLGKQALLQMAECRRALYKGHPYDTSDLIGRPLNPQSYYDSAKSSYEKFKRQYPQDADGFSIEKRLNEIDEQLAVKQFEIGRYYQERGNMLSASLYYRMVVDRWPRTETAKKAAQMLVQNAAPEENDG